MTPNSFQQGAEGNYILMFFFVLTSKVEPRSFLNPPKIIMRILQKYVCFSKLLNEMLYFPEQMFCLLLLAPEPSYQKGCTYLRCELHLPMLLLLPLCFYFCFCIWRMKMLTQHLQMVGAGCLGVRR